MSTIAEEIHDQHTGSAISRDYAVVSAGVSHVMMEANEWNPETGLHYVVTLNLHPAEARRLSDSLVALADRVEASRKKMN